MLENIKKKKLKAVCLYQCTRFLWRFWVQFRTEQNVQLMISLISFISFPQLCVFLLNLFQLFTVNHFIPFAPMPKTRLIYMKQVNSGQSRGTPLF